MSSLPPSGLFTPRPRTTVVRDLLTRTRRQLEDLPDTALVDVLQDALYTERKRLERAPARPGEREHLDALARALVDGGRERLLDASSGLLSHWIDEIHGRFDPRVYRFTTRLLPRALTGLLAHRPRRLREIDFSPERRLQVAGDLPLLRELAREATLVLVPTHVSNLDSPLIGLALHLAGLPPFVYGAGLNLFDNPVMGWFMGRLGAYTVDRTKRARLYKDVLKDYSVRCLTTRHHSLFFPGGTRSRSGAIESHLKKGLLGTGIAAWQEMLQRGERQPEVYVVPLTLTFQLVLEANTLVGDHLAESGRQRYIITDDESADARRIAQFARRILDLDASVVARFGQPLDVLGRPVSSDPVERAAQAKQRRGYVCGRDGRVERDAQRDRVYTDRLADAIVREYPRNHHVMANHLAAWVGWRCLEDVAGTRDPFRLVRVVPGLRRVDRATFLTRLGHALDQVHDGAAAGRWHTALPRDPVAVLDEATDRFGRYHRTRALAARDGAVVVDDPKLCLYYRNRVAHMGLEG